MLLLYYLFIDAGHTIVFGNFKKMRYRVSGINWAISRVKTGQFGVGLFGTIRVST